MGAVNVRSVLHIKRDTGSGKRDEMNYTYGAHVQGAPGRIFFKKFVCL